MVTDDWRGRPHLTSRYALHIQCPWRIVSGDGVVVGYTDIAAPRSGLPDDDSFDRDVVGSTRRDELLKRFFGARAAAPRRVTDCKVGAAGWLSISLDDGSALEVVPDTTAEADLESWRLFEMGSDADHLVVRGSGIQRVGPRLNSA